MKEHLNAVILAVAILLAVVVYCFGTRYQIVKMGQQAYEVDRITGKTWFLWGSETIPSKPPDKNQKVGKSEKKSGLIFEDFVKSQGLEFMEKSPEEHENKKSLR